MRREMGAASDFSFTPHAAGDKWAGPAVQPYRLSTFDFRLPFTPRAAGDKWAGPAVQPYRPLP
jgi:hypothetical protein